MSFHFNIVFFETEDATLIHQICFFSSKFLHLQFREFHLMWESILNRGTFHALLFDKSIEFT